MSGCCQQFDSTEQSAVRTPAPVMLPLDDCNNKAVYDGVAGADFEFGTPVAASPVPNTVDPVLTGVDAIGVSLSTVAAGNVDRRVTVARTGHIGWSDVAAAIGANAASLADWWPVHIQLAKHNIYVEFNR